MNFVHFDWTITNSTSFVTSPLYWQSYLEYCPFNIKATGEFFYCKDCGRYLIAFANNLLTTRFYAMWQYKKIKIAPYIDENVFDCIIKFKSFETRAATFIPTSVH